MAVSSSLSETLIDVSGRFDVNTEIYKIDSDNFIPESINAFYIQTNTPLTFAYELSEQLSDISARFDVNTDKYLVEQKNNYIPDSNFIVYLGDAAPLEAAFNENLANITTDFSANFYEQNKPVGVISANLSEVGSHFIASHDTRAYFHETINITGNFICENEASSSSLSETLTSVVGGLNAIYDPNNSPLLTKSNLSTAQYTTTNNKNIALYNEQASHKNTEKQSLIEKTIIVNKKNHAIVEQAYHIKKLLCNDIKTTTDKSKITIITHEQTTRTNNDVVNSVIEHTNKTTHQKQFVYEQATVSNAPTVCSIIFDTALTQHNHRTQLPYTGQGYIPIAVNFAIQFNRNSYTQNNIYIIDPKIYDYSFNSHTLGVVSQKHCAALQATTEKENLNCSIIEQTKQPETGKTPWIDNPRPEPDPTPPSGNTIIVATKEVYTMQNIITTTLADDTTIIHLGNINLSIDADTYSWSFNAQLLDKSQKPLLTPRPDGTPVELHITINGYLWHVIVEKIITSRTFEGASINLSGRGLSGLLGKPYQAQNSMNQGSLLAIEQIIDTILPIDWTMNYQLPTWNIPAGAYSHTNKTPIDALIDIMRAIGGVIKPHNSAKILTFQPRYPVLPWHYANVAVDVQIPASAITELTEEPTSNYQANGVYIHGGEIGGQLGLIRLNGTAGDRLAPTTNNNLMTDVIALRTLGERILAGQYQQPQIRSITTFMDGTTVPLVNIGDYIGFDVDGQITKGICNAINITATTSQVNQSITIGEQTTNNWVAFNDLLPKEPMLVGTLTSTDGTTSLIGLIDGGAVRVRGTGTVNNKYYIRSGEIVSQAPDLPLNEIVI